MKYKLLLLGMNTAAITDFFVQLEDEFELQTSSMQFNDIKSHVKYFQPHAIVYCLYNESRDSITRIATIKQRPMGRRIPYVIIGTQLDCDEFNAQAVNIANLTLAKPLTASSICDRLNRFLGNIYDDDTEENLASIAGEAKGTAARSAAPAAEKKAQAAEPSDGGVSTPQKQAPDFFPTENKQKTILVVDDDIRMVKVIKRYLEQYYTVATAVSGSVALRYLDKKNADLILLDYMMPEMDGPQVLEKLREHRTTADIPVVFLTGAAEREKIQKALSMKPQGYLLKPINGDKLMAKIHELIG